MVPIKIGIGGQISVPGNAVIAGNGDAAELFGLDTSLANPTVTLSGRSGIVICI